MCALHVSPLPMFRATPKPQAPYSATQNRSRPEQFPLRAVAAERLSVEQFQKRRRAPDDDYDSLQPSMRSSYPSSPMSSRAIQYSGSGYNPPLKSSRPRDAMYQGPAQHDHYGGFDEARGERTYPSTEPPRGRRIPHARPASASLPGLSAILQSSNSPPQPQQQQYQRPIRRPDAPPISVALANHSSNSVAHPQQRTMSWSSNSSPLESPLFTRNALGAVRPPHWGSAVVSEAQQREMRDSYGSFYHDHHQQQQRLSQPHQLTNRRGPTNGHASPSSSLSGEELLDTAEADHASPAVAEARASGNKNSRYLREMDRRAILERLANGEKQAALAKEFQVSRAAICNLNKHRDEVMSRADENPFAKHPKKRKVRVASVKSSPNESSTPTIENQSMPAKAEEGLELEPLVIKAVHVVQSRAVQLLMTTLRSHTTPLAEFRRCSDRVLRLVLEDALALVPTTTVDVYLNDQVKVEGVSRQHALCGISLEQRHCPVMDMFHVIEPDQPTGYVRCSNGDVTLLDAHLPKSLASHNVFLFDLVAASGETVCATLEQLLARGAVESRLYVVALFVASDVVAAVQCTFPRVHIVTAQIDASVNASQKPRRRSDTGRLDGMLARFAEIYNDRI